MSNRSKTPAELKAPTATSVSPPLTAAQDYYGAPEQAPSSTLSKQERREALISEAAYFRAARRGFTPGEELEDWLEAEKEVDARLSQAR